MKSPKMENKAIINRTDSLSNSDIRVESNPKVYVLPEENVISSTVVAINIQ